MINRDPTKGPGDDPDQNNLLLVVLLSVGFVMLWQFMYPTVPVENMPAQQSKSADSKTMNTPDPAATASANPSSKGPAALIGVEGTASQSPIRRKVVGTLEVPSLHGVELSNDDGQIASWILLEKQYQLRQEDGTSSDFRFVDGENRAPVSSLFLPPILNLSVEGQPARGEYTLVKSSADSAVLRWVVPGSGMVVERRYQIDADSYALKVALVLKNPLDRAISYDLTAIFGALQNDEEASGSMFMPPLHLYESIFKGADGLERLDANEIKDMLEDGESTRFQDGLTWAGVDNRYFMTALLPQPADIESSVSTASKPTLPGITGFTQLTNTLELAGGKVPARGEVVRTLQFYAGPKKLSELDSQTPSLEEAIDFGWFSVICVPMLWLMRAFFEQTTNWGIAIILLTVLVKLLTLPLTIKQYRSMAAMKKVQPEMKKLQAKWKDDKVRLQQEMMKLYQEHKVNPLSGCLPMFMMMPIYFALYRTIYSAVELYQADFFFWITDLSKEDPFYVTPVVLGALMFLQFRLNPSTGDEVQQKIMMYMMPVMFSGMMLFLPSGLVLYILVNTMLGLVQQYYQYRRVDPAPAAAKQGAG